MSIAAIVTELGLMGKKAKKDAEIKPCPPKSYEKDTEDNAS